MRLRFVRIGLTAHDTSVRPPAACPRGPSYPLGGPTGDEDDWRSWRAVGDEVLHIELRRWADAVVIAPLSANTLAKAANGLCDNLLTCVVRAWDWQKPLLVRCSSLALQLSLC